MGSSYYVDAVHPLDIKDRSEDELAEEIVSDITNGVGNSGIKSGVISEVGCTWPLTDNERKVLRASGRAQCLTGAPITIHLGRDERVPMEALEILSKVGVDLNKTINNESYRENYI